MSPSLRRSSLSARLAISHVLVVSSVGLLAAVALMGLFYVVEDRIYAALVSGTLEGPVPGLRSWTEESAPESLKKLVDGRADGVHELDDGDKELHVGVATLPSGERRLVTLASGEVGPGTLVPTLFAAGMLALALLAAWLGAFMAQRILAPLGQLSATLDSGVGASVTPGLSPSLREIEGEDEVGRIARRIAGYLEEREAALAREAEFLRDASHELRNPLSILHGAVALLRKTGPVDATTLGVRLDRMDRSVTRMRRTVEGLLSLARQEASAMEEAQGTLEQAAVELIEEYRLLAPSEVTLNLTFQGSPPGRLELWSVVLRNLLANAMNATSAGTVSISIAPDRLDVEDSGPGIDPKLAARAMRAFEAGDESEGFGLGLSIVQRLARRMGWSVEIDGGPEGTRVTLRPNP